MADNRVQNSNGYDEEPDFSDPDDYFDDVDDEELVGDLLRQKPTEADGLEACIVVDNIPVVGDAKLSKLKKIIEKIFKKFGTILNEFYPLDDDNNTKGFMFIEYQEPQYAAEAVKMANGYKLDKAHSFAVNLFSDFEKYKDVQASWQPSQKQDFTDHGNLYSWLLDEDAADQFSVIFESGKQTSIFRNNVAEPETVQNRENWTETYVRWSPKGTYLATFHGRGIALWGGEKFEQILRLPHHGVQLIDFSPCERYVVTFSPVPDMRSDDPKAIIIWDIRTGLLKRSFSADDSQGAWPAFLWSQDGEYLARRGDGVLSVYESSTFGLLDKKSIKLPGIKNFSWSPTDKVIAYWVPEDSNVPCRVTLISIPERQELCVKNLFNVKDCCMHWQAQGDYLGVKVDRYTKIRKTDEGPKYGGIYHNFELFRLREKQIPVDKIEVKEPVQAFGWEPNGDKFCLLRGEGSNISADFYRIIPAGKVELIKSLDKRQANHIFWSPTGQFVVLAGLRSMNGMLEFIDTSDMSQMAMMEHFMATDLEWDPTGRYVASGVSWWGHKMDNAYWLWSFQGRVLAQQRLSGFCQLLWRPRPPTLLSKKKQKEIKKNLSNYKSQFDAKDIKRKGQFDQELSDKRRKMFDKFDGWKSRLGEQWREAKSDRLRLRGGLDTDSMDSKDNFENKVVEFLLEVKETVVEE